MAIGMTYEQYWYGDVHMVRAFREADKLRQQRINQEAHLQGLYFYEALLDVSPILHAFAKKGTKPIKYSAKPYELFNDKKNRKIDTEEERERKEERERLQAKLYMRNFVRALKGLGEK